MKPKPLALIIDNERAARRLMRVALELENYRLIEAQSGGLGLNMAVNERPDVIILDLELPDMDGLVVLQRLREWCLKPVLVLSGRNNVRDKVGALDAGANDYVTKPFEPLELLARLRVHQRIIPGIIDGPLLIEGDLKVNLATHEVTFRESRLLLTPTEEALFFLLARYAGKVVTYQHFLRAVWGSDTDEKTHELRVYMGLLRKKLNHHAGIMIAAEGGIGYRLALGEPQETNLVTSVS